MGCEGERSRNAVSGLLPEHGAIFMSNDHTKRECLRKKLFGLPSSFYEFVRNVKVGMVLFLFEYEHRRLYGVFEAASDGEINIVPSAYGSSGKRFPAQVQVKRIWNCEPLSEQEFSIAIKDNYYSPKKFHFGLTKDQVLQLLHLFSSRKSSRDLNSFTLREFRTISRRPSRICDSGTSVPMDAVSSLQEVTRTSCFKSDHSSHKHSSSSQISQRSVNFSMGSHLDLDSGMTKGDKISNVKDELGDFIPLSVSSDNTKGYEAGGLLPLDDQIKPSCCELCEDGHWSEEYIPLPVPVLCGGSSERFTTGRDSPILSHPCMDHTDVEPYVPVPVFQGRSFETITTLRDSTVGTHKCSSSTVVESSFDAKQGKEKAVVGCQESCNVGKGPGNPSNDMKTLYSDAAPRKRKSVFTRLNFGKKNKQEENSLMVDYFMNEILEELQLKRNLESAAPAREVSNSSKSSVFQRLGAGPSKSNNIGQKQLHSTMDSDKYSEFMQMHSLEWDEEVLPSAQL